jgi:hypothetical protein
VLYGEYPVERDLGVTDDRPAGLDGEAWHQDAAGGAFGLDRVGDPLGEGGDVRAPLTGAVRQRVPAGEAQLGQTAQLRETLRDLAEAGNETALDRLADLADADGDLEELSGLLDEGSMHAGLLLTRRALAAGDLRELQRISDAGFEKAGEELERLLRAPNGRPRD